MPHMLLLNRKSWNTKFGMLVGVHLNVSENWFCVDNVIIVTFEPNFRIMMPGIPFTDLWSSECLNGLAQKQ